jgi:hypothetical protein
MFIMKTTQRIIIIGLLVALASCQHDLDMLVINPGELNGPDTMWVSGVSSQSPSSQLREDIRKSLRKDSFALNTTSTTIVNLSSGIQLRIPGESIQTLSGNAYQGLVNAESILLRNNGDLIRMGISSRFNEQLLINEGTIFLRLLDAQNQPLDIDPANPIEIRFDPFGQYNPGIKLFIGSTTLQDPGFNWIPIADSMNYFVAASDYRVITNQLGWISCSRIGSVPPNQRTRLEVSLPKHYTNNNTMVFVSLNRYRVMIRLNGNPTTRSFQSGSLPVNEPITLVVLSKQGNQFFMKQQTLSLRFPQQNSLFDHIEVEPVITNLTSIQQYLDQL